jgi:hypothetical protein
MPVALLLNAYTDCIDNSIGVLAIVLASSANALRIVPWFIRKFQRYHIRESIRFHSTYFAKLIKDACSR